jgi:hypothetical protein
MALGWKVLIPVGLVWVLITGALVLIEEAGGLSRNARLGLVADSGTTRRTKSGRAATVWVVMPGRA